MALAGVSSDKVTWATALTLPLSTSHTTLWLQPALRATQILGASHKEATSPD